MSLDPYLYFNGECRAAFDFYRAVFGGDFTVLQTYAEAPDSFPVAATEDKKIMHVALPIGTSMLMGSDVPEESGSFTRGDDVHISYSPANREECDARFAALARGGKITMALQDTFWGAYFGSLTDHFGVHWMFNLSKD